MKNWEKYEEEIKECGYDIARVNGSIIECSASHCDYCDYNMHDCDVDKMKWLYEDADEGIQPIDTAKEYIMDDLVERINEIVDAVNKFLAQENVHSKEITIQDINEHLYLPDVPEPDLIIRSSGELRTSNFLLWEAAYSEYYISDVLWPDFTRKDLIEAIVQFNTRDRRFGGVQNG